MYGEISKGCFNMIKVEDFFVALKLGWVRRYVRGLDDNWADLDIKLNLDTTNRVLLLDRASEHPSFVHIVNGKIPCISAIFCT